MSDDYAISDAEKRVTAPQQPYTFDDVQYGFAVLVIGVILTFVLPFLLV